MLSFRLSSAVSLVLMGLPIDVVADASLSPASREAARTHVSTVEALPDPTTADARLQWDRVFADRPIQASLRHLPGPLRAEVKALRGASHLSVKITVYASPFRPAASCDENTWPNDRLELGINLKHPEIDAGIGNREARPSGLTSMTFSPGPASMSGALCAFAVSRGDDRPLGALDHAGAVSYDASTRATRYYLTLGTAILGQALSDHNTEVFASLRIISGATPASPFQEARWGLPPVSGLFPGRMAPLFSSVGSLSSEPNLENQRQAKALRAAFAAGIGRLEKARDQEASAQVQDSRRAQIALMTQAFGAFDSQEQGDLAERKRLVQAIETLAERSMTHSSQLYLGGDLPLTFAVRADEDGRLAANGMRLPRKSGPPGQKPPLLVVLHGKGDPEEASFLTDLESARPGWAGADEAIILTPYARGNMGYYGGAERDVLSAIEALISRGTVDANRVMLLGFSMGGAGAWSLLLHHPDVWSGVAIAAGGTWLAPRGMRLGANVQHIPVWLWHGLKDTTIRPQETHWMQEELEVAGGRPKVTWGLKDRHHLPEGTERTLIEHLMTTRRKHPSHFTFTSDGYVHREAYGIRMAAQRGRSDRTIRVARRDHHVSLWVGGNEGLDIDLKRLMGDSRGDVQVILNRREIYRGPKIALQVAGGSGR